MQATINTTPNSRAQRRISVVPQLPVWMMRLPDVVRATGLSKTTLYARIKEGSFPASVPLGGKAVGWPSDQVEAWIADLLASAAEKGA
ncbi:MAG: AlpA family phage regulatory protein [Laribacter sp.]|nr:AlpA family phage regulatory protein [Laribacter sp.]